MAMSRVRVLDLALGSLFPRPDPFHSVRISFMAAIRDALNHVTECVSVSVPVCASVAVTLSRCVGNFQFL